MNVQEMNGRAKEAQSNREDRTEQRLSVRKRPEEIIGQQKRQESDNAREAEIQIPYETDQSNWIRYRGE